jgi:hypothetical protein
MLAATKDCQFQARGATAMPDTHLVKALCAAVSVLVSVYHAYLSVLFMALRYMLCVGNTPAAERHTWSKLVNGSVHVRACNYTHFVIVLQRSTVMRTIGTVVEPVAAGPEATADSVGCPSGSILNGSSGRQTLSDSGLETTYFCEPWTCVEQ